MKQLYAKLQIRNYKHATQALKYKRITPGA